METGPKEIVIPEQKYPTCVYCQYYDHRMFKSGREPIYNSMCLHPSLSHKSPFLKIIDSSETPVRTPSWCPMMEIQNQIDTINTEI